MKRHFSGIFIFLFCLVYQQAISQSAPENLEALMDSIVATRSTDRPAAIQFCLEAEKYAKQINNYERLDEIYYTLGSVYTWINQVNSIKYSKKGIFLAHENNQPNESAKYYVLLGRNSSTRENYEQALEYFELADSIFTSIDSKDKIAWVNSNIGHAFLELTEYEKAIAHLSESVEIYNTIGEPENTTLDLINMGRCYEKLGQTEKAISLYKEANEISIEGGDLYGSSTSRIMLAGYHHANKNYQEAIRLAEAAALDSKKSQNFYTLKTIYHQLYESYEAISNYENALKYLTLHNVVSDSLGGTKNDQLIADLQNTLDVEKRNYEHELLKKEKSRLIYKEKVQASQNRLLVILLICSSVILITIIIILIGRSRNARLKQQLHTKTLIMRKKEVTNLSMYIKERGMFINLIRDDLKQIRKIDNELKKNKLISSLLVKVGTYAKIDNESMHIQEQIKESTQGFMARLNEKFPNLTTKEKRLAQLLYMNLSSKEIALLLNIASQSVDTARYRLRKKLNLSKEEDLNSIFKDI